MSEFLCPEGHEISKTEARLYGTGVIRYCEKCMTWYSPEKLIMGVPE